MPGTRQARSESRQKTKRQNFNITPEQEAEIAWLKDALGAPTTKDTILRAVHVLTALAHQTRQGHHLYVGTENGKLDRLLIPELEPMTRVPYLFLVERPHPWRRQLWVKGRRLLASTVWHDLLANAMSATEAAENWDLPVEAIEEIVRYCEANQALLSMEADEERRRLREADVALEPSQASQ